MELQQSMLVLGEYSGRTTANAKVDGLRIRRRRLGTAGNRSSYQTRLIGKLYDSTVKHPIVVLCALSPQHQPRLGAPLLCDFV
jgi:hypothetical protein